MVAFILRVIFLTILITFFSFMFRILGALFLPRMHRPSGKKGSPRDTRKTPGTIVLAKDDYHVE